MQPESYFATTYSEPFAAAVSHAEMERMQRGGNYIEDES